MECDDVLKMTHDQLQSAIENGRPFHLDKRMLDQINPMGLDIYPNELQDSLADFTYVLDYDKICDEARDSQKVDS